MAIDNDRITGPGKSDHIEFSGRSPAEMFRVAADWFAANDGEVGHVLAVGFRELPEFDGPQTQTVYTLSIAYDR
ncbi:hypothetical protein [Nocardia nova]|uniref:hypothetical protein n=1 Tax=Nocardia nova TaxID=37330 RepID=UPI0007A425FB|nr:hypothetical protein [Nocardia nova]